MCLLLDPTHIIIDTTFSLASRIRGEVEGMKLKQPCDWLNDRLERKGSVDLWKEETSIGCESSCFVLLTS